MFLYHMWVPGTAGGAWIGVSQKLVFAVIIYDNVARKGLKFPLGGFYSYNSRVSPPVPVIFQLKVVVSLSPCFRGDFPESVTADRYVTSE